MCVRLRARRAEAVSLAPNGLDRLRAELPAEVGDVDVRCALVADEVAVPELLENLPAADDLAGVVRQQAEHAELEAGQRDAPAAAQDGADEMSRDRDSPSPSAAPSSG